MCNCGKKRHVIGSQDGGRAVENPPVPAPAPAVRRVSPIKPTPAPTVRAPPTRVVEPVRPTPVVRAPPPVRVVEPVRVARPAARQVPVVRSTLRRAERIIDPVIWGPPLWRILHSLAEVAETNTAWPTLLNALRTGLPCPDCSSHYNAWIDSHAVGTGTGIKAWLLALHNDVNRRKGVAEWTPEMVTAAAGRVRRMDLEAQLRRIRNKVGDAACQILTSMIGGLSV